MVVDIWHYLLCSMAYHLGLYAYLRRPRPTWPTLKKKRFECPCRGLAVPSLLGEIDRKYARYFLFLIGRYSVKSCCFCANDFQEVLC